MELLVKNDSVTLLDHCRLRLRDAAVQLEFATEHQLDERRCHSALSAFIALTHSIHDFLKSGQGEVKYQQLYKAIYQNDPIIQAVSDFFYRARRITLHRRPVSPKKLPIHAWLPLSEPAAWHEAGEEFLWIFEDAPKRVDGAPIDALELCKLHLDMLNSYVGLLAIAHIDIPLRNIYG